MAFEWSFRLGDCVVLIGMLAAAGGFLYRKGGDLERLQMAVTSTLNELQEVKQEVKKMGQVLTELAVQKEQIAMLTKWYDELRRMAHSQLAPRSSNRIDN